MTFWLNGDWRTDETAISIRDRGLLLGDGVFETMRVERGAAIFLTEHLQRLENSLVALKLPAALPQNLPAIIRDLAVKNDCANASASMRLTVTRGISTRGLPFPEVTAPNVLMTIWPAPPLKEVDDKPLCLMISKYRRSTISFGARHKTLGYLDNIMARQDAVEAGTDDAIMLNEHGRAACASVANIFAITPNGDVVTPGLEDGALPGIVRQVLLAKTKNGGVKIAEGRVDEQMLKRSMLFLTNSLIGLRHAVLYPAKFKTNRAEEEIFNHLRTCYEGAVLKSLGQGKLNQ